MMMDDLNKAQQEAVAYTAGPQLVIAGAGSGKTRVLTYKIAYLLSHDVKPWNILALTFTNKAAREMRDRISQLVSDESVRYLSMGTFHSIFSRILRSEANMIGYTSQFTIYDDSDSRSLLKTIVKEMGLDDKIYKPALLLKNISRAKNNIELPHDYAANEDYALRDKYAKTERMPQIYEEYERRLRLSGAMDFDDLLLKTYLLFRDHSDIRMKYGERFRYVLVDEYQDTNSVQQNIVSLIVRQHNRITVVGDDAQSIYAFRGADINNILTFKDTFSHIHNPDGSLTPSPVRIFKLEQNYRSTQTIVKAANSVISHNKRQIPKDVYSENERGEAIRLLSCETDREEAHTVCTDIRRSVRSGTVGYGDIAILYRTNAQSRTLEEALGRYAMPYRIIGGLSFYQRKEIKDIIAYFRLAVNNYDEEALRRVINYPARGIGSTTLQKVLTCASQHGIAPWDVISSPDAVQLNVSGAAKGRLRAFASMVMSFSKDIAVADAAALGERIIRETGISSDIFQGDDIEDKARQENVSELRNSLSEFVDSHEADAGGEVATLTAFLQEIALLTDLDSTSDNEDGMITLMTIHAAKGLEFHTVYIVGLEDQIIPSQQAIESPFAMEEERRLLYVAMTRARKRCLLSFARNRYRYGRQEYETPSRFLFDIDRRYLRGAEALGRGDELDILSVPSGGTHAGKSLSAASTTTPSSPFRASSVHAPVSTPSSPFHASSVHAPVSTPRASVSTPLSGRRLTRLPSTPASTPRYTVSSRQETAGVKAGMRIEHRSFGRGIVLSVEGTGENTKARVEFDDGGVKQLLIKYAKFTILG